MCVVGYSYSIEINNQEEIIMSQITEGGLQQLDIQGGDSVVCIHTIGNLFTAGTKYRVITDNEGDVGIFADSGSFICDSHSTFKKVLDYSNPPHKHRDLIIAWANGAEIELKRLSGEWELVGTPRWVIEAKYRIKPTQTKSPAEIERDEIKAEMDKLAVK